MSDQATAIHAVDVTGFLNSFPHQLCLGLIAPDPLQILTKDFAPGIIGPSVFQYFHSFDPDNKLLPLEGSDADRPVETPAVKVFQF